MSTSPAASKESKKSTRLPAEVLASDHFRIYCCKVREGRRLRAAKPLLFCPHPPSRDITRESAAALLRPLELGAALAASRAIGS